MEKSGPFRTRFSVQREVFSSPCPFFAPGKQAHFRNEVLYSRVELNQAKKCMQNNKAAGPDGFAVEIDKYASGPEARTY